MTDPRCEVDDGKPIVVTPCRSWSVALCRRVRRLELIITEAVWSQPRLLPRWGLRGRRP
ncbi:MAG: hypothetical protein ACRD0K_16745 [Egibacteraceae bacterium]